MKKVSPTIIVLGVISIVELIVTHAMVGSIWLWVLYGLYKTL